MAGSDTFTWGGAPQDVDPNVSLEPVTVAPPTATVAPTTGKGSDTFTWGGIEQPAVEQELPADAQGPQFSIFGTALPGTAAARVKAEPHPLTRAALQTVELTRDMDSNQAAIKKVIKGVYGDTINGKVIDDLTPEYLQDLIKLPTIAKALNKDTITRQKIARDAEMAAILKGDIPTVLAAEGHLGALKYIGMSKQYPEEMTVEAIEARQLVEQGGFYGAMEALVNAVERGPSRAWAGLLQRIEEGRYRVGVAAGKDPVDAFIDQFKATAFNDFSILPGPDDLLEGLGSGIGAVLDVYRSGGFSAENAARLQADAVQGMEEAFTYFKKVQANLPMSPTATEFMQKFQKLPNNWGDAIVGMIELIAEDPLAFAQTSTEILGEQSAILAGSAALTAVAGPQAGISLATLGAYTQERFNADEKARALIKTKFGYDMETEEGLTAYMKDPAAVTAYNRAQALRGVTIAAGNAVGFRMLQKLPFKSAALNFSYATGTQGIIEGGAEYLAGIASTGKSDPKEAIAEAVFGMNPGQIAIEATIAGVSDFRQGQAVEAARQWLRTGEAVRDEIAGIDVNKLNSVAEILGEKLDLNGSPDVFIDAGALLQFDQDGNVSETLGLDPVDVRRAAAEGDRVQVSAETYIRHIVGSDGFAQLLPHTTDDAAGLTAKEAEQYTQEDIEGQISETLEKRVLSRLAPRIDAASVEKLANDVVTIQETVAAQLQETGVYDAERSQVLALLTAQRYATRAVRMTEETGQPVDALSLYAQDNLQITGRAEIRPQVTFEQAQKGFVDERIPQLEEAARQRSEGEITQEQYQAVVDEFKPVLPYESVPEPATVEEMQGALASNKVGRLGKGQEAVGQQVGLRLDIPAYTQYGVWVPTIHDPRGKPIAHEAAAQITGVSFTEPGAPAEAKAGRVGRGEATKSPFAQIQGTLQSVDPAELKALAEQAINDPAWTQVGYDPRRHTFFYDRKTQQPVLAADEVIQVGPLVLAKNAQFGDAEAFLFQEGTSLFETPLTVAPTGKNNRILIKDIGQTLTDDHINRVGEQLFPEENEEHFQQVFDMAVAEMDAQLERANSGVGWYDKDVNDAINITAGPLFPTLLTEPGHRDFFLILAGIFSNGTNPSQAWGMSAGAYEIFLESGVVPVQRRNADGTPVKMTTYKDKKTGEQITKPAGWGVRNGANEQHLQFFKHLVETQGGLQQAADWMLAEHTPAEINEMMLSSGAFKAGKYKTKKELEGAPERGVMVFGPKLGRYTMGLLGIEIDANDTTVDLWYTRTFRRWTGRLMEPPIGNEGVAAQPDPKNDEAERKSIFRLTGALAERYDIGPGDVQAALWFFEKRLWATHGAQLDEGTNSQGARKLLADRGIDVAERGDQPSTADAQVTLEQQPLDAGPRGGFTPADRITDQEGNPVNLIQIFEKADVTTFLHESGHFWLEQLKDDAAAVGGQFGRDWDVVRNWWGSRPLELREEAVKRAKKAKDKDAADALQKMSEAKIKAYARAGDLRGEGTMRYVSIAMHEQFARGVESYFATGRAPSLSLASAFNAFKVWVLSVYTKLFGTRLDVQFSPEVTQVMDRMLAADEEIALVEGQYEMAALLDNAEQAGLTPEKFAEYQRQLADVKSDRRAKQLAKHIKELKRARTKWWNAEREKMRPEVTAEIAAQRQHQLVLGLTAEGADRMDRATLVELLKEQGVDVAALPRVGSKAIYEADGVSPAAVALEYGYADVNEMLSELIDYIPLNDVVETTIDERMEAEHGSIESTGETEALHSAYSDKTARILATELEALRTTEPAFKQQFVRAYARNKILDLPSEQVRPYQFLLTERRHAKLAAKALKKGDRVEAYRHQFQRLVNHYMAREAIRAQRDVEKKTRYLRTFTKRGAKFPSIEASYVDNILRILEAVNMDVGPKRRRGRSVEVIALQEFITAKQAEDGSLLDVPAWLLDTAAERDVRKMKYLHFLELHETVQRYEKQGRAANKIRRGDEEIDRELAKAELLAALSGRNRSRVSRLRDRGATPGEAGTQYRVAAALASVDAQLLKIENLLEAIDGKPLGVWHQTIYEPFNKAAAEKYVLQEEISQVIGELIANLPRSVRRGFGKRVDVGRLGKPGLKMTRGSLIMLALNVGNASNLDKLIRGMGGDPDTNVKGAGWNINEQLIDEALQQLTQEEWALVEGVWRHAEKLYPAVEEIYRAEHGVSPDRVEPRTVSTPYGDIQGGYFPMMYDRTIAGVAADLNQKTALELMQAETGRASVNSSMTKARTGYAAPVDLDISRLAMGMDNTIHFITHYGAVRNANKILGDRTIRAELEDKVGIAYTDQLLKWVAALASNGNDSPPVDIIQKLLMHLHTNTTIAVLGFSYSTLGMQSLGLINGVDRIAADTTYGPITLAEVQKDIAVGAAAAARPDHVRFIQEVSVEMRARRQNMDREVATALRRLVGKEGLYSRGQRFAMEAIAHVQFYTVDIPVWTAAYNRALRGDPSDTNAAVKYADRVVRASQSAGGLKDLAAVQRHKGLMKGLTMFYSWFSAFYAVLRQLGAQFSENVRRNPAAATTRAATRLFVLLALSSLGAGAIKGDLPDVEPEDEDEKGLLRYIAENSAVTALGVIPVVRDVAQGMLTGFGYRSGLGATAFEAADKSLSEIVKVVDEYGEEVIDDETNEEVANRLKPFVLLAGALFGLPSVQLNRFMDGYAAMLDDAENWNWTDLVRGYSEKRALARD